MPQRPVPVVERQALTPGGRAPSLRYADVAPGDERTDRASQDRLPGTPWVLVDGTPLERPTAETLAAAVESAVGG